MKRLIGLVLILIAIVGGLYLGAYICFLRSVANIFNNIKVGIDGIYIAINICKIVLALVIVYFFLIILAIGLAEYQRGKDEKKKIN